MAKTSMTTVPATVEAYLLQLDEPLRAIVAAVRQIILAASPEIGEQIKWNSPSYYFTGDMPPFNPREYKRDIVVMNLHRGHLLLVFPSGAKIPGAPALLEGSYADGRRLVRIHDVPDAHAKGAALQLVLQQWLALVAQ